MARQRPVRVEDLFELKVPGRAVTAPDGTRIAFELKRLDSGENSNFAQLMIVDVATGALRELTRPGRHSDTFPQFSPDGSRLAFLSNREKPTGLWILPLDGGDPRRITDREGIVHDFAWSPDGRKLVYTYQPLSEREKLERDDKSADVQKRPTFKHISRLTHKLDGAGYWNGHRTHVFVAPADGGKPRQLTTGDYDHSEPRFSPDGRTVSFISNRTDDPDRFYDQSDVFTISTSGGRPKRVTLAPGECGGHAWSPDGRTIAFLGGVFKHGEWWKHNTRVFVVPAVGGKPQCLTSRIDNDHVNLTMGDVAGATFARDPLQWSIDGRRLYFTVSERGAGNLYSIGLEERTPRPEVVGRHAVQSVRRTGPGGPFALVIGTNVNPADVYAYDPDSRDEPRRLTRINESALSRLSIVEPEEFELKSGPVALQCWVIKPPGFRANAKHAAILQIHGGPQAQYGYGFFHEMQLMASRGYVVTYTNPRGSAGYGVGFRSSIVGKWGGDDHADVKRLGDWLFSRPWIDKKRVGVTGGSYGGYMTNWVIAHESRYRAAVTQRCVSDFATMFGTSDFGHAIVAEMGGPPWKNIDAMRRRSPLTYVEKMKTPLLIIHSEQDLRCAIEQAQQLFNALKYLGRDVEFVAFEGESHGLSRIGRPQNRAERLRRILGWFDRWMK